MKNWEDEPITDLDLELEAMLEKATPVKGRAAKNLTIVFSVRLSPGELDEFNAAAKAGGMNLSEFMRAATRAAIQGELDLSKASALGEVKEKVRELNEAIEKLTA